MKGQAFDQIKMRQPEVQQVKAVAADLCLHDLSDRLRQVQLADRDFDGGFPRTGTTQIKRVAFLLEQLSRQLRQVAAETGNGEPQKRMRVEQKVHGMYSAKSSSGSLKSALIHALPSVNPP